MTEVPRSKEWWNTGPSIQAENITRCFGDKTALDGVTLEIEKDKFSAFKGVSGSGKTTLLNCLSGLDMGYDGTVRVGGEDLSDFSEKKMLEWRRTKLGFIPQKPALFGQVNAIGNIGFPHQGPMQNDPEWIEHIIRCLGIDVYRKTPAASLSAGQQARVHIARALAHRPKFVFADELTATLDQQMKSEILKLLKFLADEQQTTFVVASHDPVELDYADKIIEISDGRVVDDH